MLFRISLTLLVFMLLFALLAPGCGPLKPLGQFYDNFTAHYNTYYNVKKYFKQAEQQFRLNRLQMDDASTPSVPSAAYQKVLEAGATLLEYYPNSRWIDDTLLLMGISYYRISEYGRAERKFSELQTIFPDSEHAGTAGIWRARAMSAQGRFDDAAEYLLAALPRLKKKSEIAEANRALGRVYAERKQWGDAIEQYQLAAPHLANRDERSNTWFELGEALFKRKSFEEARRAFQQVISKTRNLTQSYDASIYSSRCALELGDYKSAERILFSLKSDPSFADLQSSVDLEIAELAVATGRLDEGMELYQNYINESENGEAKGLAYYRLGVINRDDKLDIATAKAKFDSVNGAGASRSLIDSARAASDGLSRGLLAFARMTTLADSISEAISEIDSLQTIDWSQIQPADMPDSLLAVSDSLSPAAASGDSIVARPQTPASLLADSLVMALQSSADSGLVDGDSILVDDSNPEAMIDDSLSPAQRSAQRRIIYLDSMLVVLQTNLMSTYLQTAEFFDEALQENDSSQHYLYLAVSRPMQHDDYWKACMQLASRLASADDPDQKEIHRLCEQALTVQTIPISVRNTARERLGLAVVVPSPSPQQRRLEVAEAAYMSESVSLDSLALLYQEVLQMDSTTRSGMRALFALEYLHEYELNDYEGAAIFTQRLIDLFPDSAFVPALEAKLAPLPESSIFDLTDEQLAAARSRSHEVLTAEPDSTGWPPPEEELFGRRYR